MVCFPLFPSYLVYDTRLAILSALYYFICIIGLWDGWFQMQLQMRDWWVTEVKWLSQVCGVKKFEDVQKRMELEFKPENLLVLSTLKCGGSSKLTCVTSVAGCCPDLTSWHWMISCIFLPLNSSWAWVFGESMGELLTRQLVVPVGEVDWLWHQTHRGLLLYFCL